MEQLKVQGVGKWAVVCWPVWFVIFGLLPIQGRHGLDGGQNLQGPCPGNRLRPAADTELGIDIAGVGLDRVQREEKPGSDFWIGQSFGDELEDTQFAFAQRLD